MFEIEAARITAAGVSFQLPSGFALLEAQEPHVNTTLEIQSPDSSYAISISLDRSAKASEGELRSILSEGCYRILHPISPIQCGLLHGHQVTYLSGKRGCCEIRLDLIPNDPPCAQYTGGRDLNPLGTLHRNFPYQPRNDRHAAKLPARVI